MQTDLVIVGGGLAGLTAALFAGRLGLKPTLIMDYLIGGQVLNIERVADYPGFPEGVAGYELGPSVQQQAEDAGAQVVMEDVTAIAAGGDRHRVETISGTVFETRALILATGSGLRKLGVPGEAEFEGRGVSTCASCDAPLFSDKRVIVVGGADSALLESLTLAEHGVEVLLVHRGPALSGQQVLREAVAEQALITTRFNTEVVSIAGDNTVTSITLRTNGQTAPEPADGLFAYIGLEPKTLLLHGVVSLEPSGHIRVGPTLETDVPGIFAAGDARQYSSGQLISAAGDGATAATFAARYLRAR